MLQNVARERGLSNTFVNTHLQRETWKCYKMLQESADKMLLFEFFHLKIREKGSLNIFFECYLQYLLQHFHVSLCHCI